MKRPMFSSLLVLAVIASALLVVYIKHQHRKHFVQLQELQGQRDELNIEWGQLQLEQSTWATHGRIERLARQRLTMKNVAQEQIFIVRP